MYHHSDRYKGEDCTTPPPLSLNSPTTRRSTSFVRRFSDIIPNPVNSLKLVFRPTLRRSYSVWEGHPRTLFQPKEEQRRTTLPCDFRDHSFETNNSNDGRDGDECPAVVLRSKSFAYHKKTSVSNFLNQQVICERSSYTSLLLWIRIKSKSECVCHL